MKFNIEKALQISGNKNIYQNLLLSIITLVSFSLNFISLSFPILELLPEFECKNDKGFFEKCTQEEACKIGHENFIKKIIYHNIITDFELECDARLIIIIGLIFVSSIILGVILTSKLADLLGRRPALILCLLIHSIGAFFLSYASNIYILIGILFFMGLCVGGSYINYMFVFEFVSTSYRSICSTIISISSSLTGITYLLIFHYLFNWRYLTYISGATNIISAIILITCFEESPRYLYAKGRTNKAIHSLLIIAKKNGKLKYILEYLISLKQSNPNDSDDNRKLNSNISDVFSECKPDARFSKDNINFNYLDSLRIYNSDQEFTNEKLFAGNTPRISYQVNNYDQIKINLQEIIQNIDGLYKSEEHLLSNDEKNNLKTKDYGYLALVKYKSVRYTFLICCYMSFVAEFTAFGIGMGLKKNGSEVFIDGYVLFATDIISNLIMGIIISIPFFGRARSISFMFLLASISSAGYYLLNLFELKPYDIILLGASRFGINSVNFALNTYTTEIYPTVIRAKGVGINSFVGRISLFLVVVLVELINPFLIYSSLCFFAFILTFYLTETLGRDLEDFINEEN